MIAPGTRFGSYEIVSLLGSGGMGEVYRARDPRLGRDVAIKVIRGEVSRDPERLERLHREARAVAALNHPHICAVHDVGPDYLVMEYVEGAPLHLPLTPEKAVEYGLQILDALGAAHAKGIIHRDLKPANLLVTPRGIKLLDFGVAAVSGTPCGGITDEITRASAAHYTVAGTPGYMAPEQMHGIADARTDIYAFGCVLNQMLTGRRPTLQRAPIVHRGLERVVTKCLAENPAERFQTAPEVAAALRAATRPSTARWLIAAAAVVTLGFGGFMLWKSQTSAAILTEQDVIVVSDFDNATGQSLFDGALKQALAFELAQSPFLRPMDDVQIRMALAAAGRPSGEKLTAALAREVCVREGAKATLEGSIASVGSRYIVGLQATNCRTGETLAREQSYADRTEDLVDALATSTTAMRQKLGETLPAVAGDDRGYKQRVTTTSLEALQAFNLGDTEWFNTGNRAASIPFYERATQLDPQFAMAWAVLGLQHWGIGEDDKGKQYIAKARTLTSGVSERERLFIEALDADARGDEDRFIALHEVLVRTYPNDPIFHNNLGGRYARRGEWDKALAEAEASIRLAPKRAGGYQVAASVLMELQRLQDAKGVLHQAIAAGLDSAQIHRSLLYIATAENDVTAQGKELAWFKSPDPVALRHVANGATAVGQFRKAEEYYARAQQASGQRVAPDQPGQFLTQFGIAAALVGKCDVATRPHAGKHPSVAALCSAPADAARYAAPLRDRTGPDAYIRGLVMLREGRHREAEELFADMVQRKVANWGPEYPAAYVGLARAAAASGNSEKARKTYEEFFAFWKDADQDVPLLVQAKKEYGALR
jgi:tetratricopeptide (TPR) repeat protein/predicted Ser/Thr protein kinase